MSDGMMQDINMMKDTDVKKDTRSSAPTTNSGTERLKADMRQFGGILLVLGICAAYGSLTGIASHIGPNGSTDSSGVPLSALFGAVFQAFIGIVAVFTGFWQLVNDKGHPLLSAFLIVIIQLAYVPYITNMVDVGKAASAGPPAFNLNTTSQVRFAGAMGILAIVAYGFALIGSLAFMAFALYAYQKQKWSERSASYYRSRSTVYNGMLILAGFTQMALGCMLINQFGSGPFANPTLVAVYVIFFPGISVFVGLLQMLVGSFGVIRSKGIALGGTLDLSFQVSVFVMWLCMLVLQVIVQVSYAPGAVAADAAPTIACTMTALALMPIYLDHKMRHTPEEISADYYGTKVEPVNDGTKVEVSVEP